MIDCWVSQDLYMLGVGDTTFKEGIISKDKHFQGYFNRKVKGLLNFS